MCGIHGVINLRSYNSSDCSKFVSDGFVAGSLRGMDSSGIFQVDSKKELYMHKEAEHGTSFINSTKTQAYIRDAATALVSVCHVRAATRGKITKENAHPFLVQVEMGEGKPNNRFIGVHNGTLNFWENKKKAGSKVEVDSEWAMQHLAEKGADAFEDISGAYAFIWWDEREPGKLQMARNSQRPLHFVVTKDKQQMYFASEAGMLAWLVDRHDIRVESEIYSLEIGKLYTFDLEGKEIAFTKGNLPAFRSSYSPPAANNNSPYRGYYDSRKWNSQLARWEEDTDFETEWDYDMWAGATESYRPHGQQSGTQRDSDGCPPSGRKAIEGIAKVLAKARNSIGAIEGEEEESNVIDVDFTVEGRTNADAENVNKMISKVLEKSRAEGSELQNNEYILPANFYSTSTATLKEQEAARKMGLLGELTWMEGVIYDPEVCAIGGEIEDYVAGQGKVRYDAELRNKTASVADRMWINNKTKSGKSGDWVCIIGLNEDDNMFIVSDLTAEGKKALHARMN